MTSDLPGRTRKLKWVFIFFLASTVIFTIWMRQFLYPLHSGDIVEFEMAKTPDHAQAIIQEWQSNGKFPKVMDSIYADYLFIFLYTITLSTGALFFARICGNELFRHAGKFFSLLILLAGVFDFVENQAMTRVLSGDITVNLVSLAYKMAISKFSLILMTIFFIGICIISWLARMAENRSRKPGLGNM
jgi:hypothetical protein